MARGKRHTPEQIVGLLRQIEVAVANGKATPAACRESGIKAISAGLPVMWAQRLIVRYSVLLALVNRSRRLIRRI